MERSEGGSKGSVFNLSCFTRLELKEGRADSVYRVIYSREPFLLFGTFAMMSLVAWRLTS